MHVEKIIIHRLYYFLYAETLVADLNKKIKIFVRNKLRKNF